MKKLYYQNAISIKTTIHCERIVKDFEASFLSFGLTGYFNAIYIFIPKKVL